MVVGRASSPLLNAFCHWPPAKTVSDDFTEILGFEVGVNRRKPVVRWTRGGVLWLHGILVIAVGGGKFQFGCIAEKISFYTHQFSFYTSMHTHYSTKLFSILI
ncbi:hypothetical protein Hanom_Chr12g01087681 [Helianthus anomalus]